MFSASVAGPVPKPVAKASRRGHAMAAMVIKRVTRCTDEPSRRGDAVLIPKRTSQISISRIARHREERGGTSRRQKYTVKVPYRIREWQMMNKLVLGRGQLLDGYGILILPPPIVQRPKLPIETRHPCLRLISAPPHK